MTAYCKLPGLLDEIEQVAGRNAAIAIALGFGGLAKEFPVPDLLAKTPDRYADHWLVTTVGTETALAIVKAIFPLGGRAEIPAARTALRRQFVLDSAGHLSNSEIATALQLTDRAVRMIKASLRKEKVMR